MRVTRDTLDSLYDSQVVDINGDKVGQVGQVYLDDASGEPAWVTVKTGLFGVLETLVPVDRATIEGDRIQVPFEKSFIKDAPNVDVDAHLDRREQDELHAYYDDGRVTTDGSRDSFTDHGAVTTDTHGEGHGTARDTGAGLTGAGGVASRGRAVADRSHAEVADRSGAVAERGPGRHQEDAGRGRGTLRRHERGATPAAAPDERSGEGAGERAADRHLHGDGRGHETPVDDPGQDPLADDYATQDPGRDGLGTEPTDPMRDDLGEGGNRL